LKKKELLLHICCAPCLIVPHLYLSDNFNIRGLWYNPNIHPLSEYLKRLEALEKFSLDKNIEVIFQSEYALFEFFQKCVFREEQRCLFCYEQRLLKTARIAKNGNFDCFSTTLLQSHQQDRPLIIQLGMDIAKKFDIEFFCYDLRSNWSEGVAISKETGLYRQQYCGCIYSEYDRYKQDLMKKKELLRNGSNKI